MASCAATTRLNWDALGIGRPGFYPFIGGPALQLKIDSAHPGNYSSCLCLYRGRTVQHPGPGDKKSILGQRRAIPNTLRIRGVALVDGRVLGIPTNKTRSKVLYPAPAPLHYRGTGDNGGEACVAVHIELIAPPSMSQGR